MKRFACVCMFILVGAFAMFSTGCTSSSGDDNSTSGTVTVTTDSSGKVSFDGNTYTVGGEFEASNSTVDVTFTTNGSSKIAEISSNDYTYNEVTVDDDNLTIYVQKVDSKEVSFIDSSNSSDTLSSTCVECSQDISGEYQETYPYDGEAGLQKPAPKTLSCADSSVSIVISSMDLQKDATSRITPYKNAIYIPQYERIASDIGYTSVEVLSGADVAMYDSMAQRTTADAVCFCGNLQIQDSNNLSSMNATEVETAITNGKVKLLVYKDKKWKEVLASISYNSGSGIHFNTSTNLRLYPFVFVVTSGTVASGTTISGQIIDAESKSGISGVSVTLGIPSLLDTISVSTDTITVESSDNFYTWTVKNSTGSTLFTQNGTGNYTFTLTESYKSQLSTDGQYYVTVSVGGVSQEGLITKSGDTYTLSMNPLTLNSYSATTDSTGNFTITGVTGTLYDYRMMASTSGYDTMKHMLNKAAVNDALALGQIAMSKANNIDFSVLRRYDATSNATDIGIDFYNSTYSFDDITGITITAPDNSTVVTMANMTSVNSTDYFSFEYYADIATQTGIYTATINLKNGGTAVVANNRFANIALPLPTNMSPADSGAVDSTTPTFTWTTGSATNTHLYYRMRVYTLNGANVVKSSRNRDMASYTVSSGVLSDSTQYQWRPEVWDGMSWEEADNAAKPSKYTIYVETILTTP